MALYDQSAVTPHTTGAEGAMWLDFPTDKDRSKYFVRDRHGAKLNLHTFIWLVEQYTNIGDTILDPMSGSGTVHFANLMGRHSIACEISEEYVITQNENLEKLAGITLPDYQDTPRGSHTILHGDCRRMLPLAQPADSVIFSPPYGKLWKTVKTEGILSEKHINIGYSDDAGNIGNLTVYPQYLAAMEEVYRLCNRSLKDGAILVTVTKDYLEGGMRRYVGLGNLQACVNTGFRLLHWHKRPARQTLFKDKAREAKMAKGTYTSETDIMDEDVLVMVKESQV